ncbi:Arc family DNA-binding protein [Pseudomonas aeruginosa]|uniref:Arc family DNA-binding protein n=1 Tax=Pseudomonas aeruginosa TaxID=287 RepID=UPI0008FB2E0F|nr:Arc family DNA-binding protein [Pseudomonas aeruginosa]EKV4554966.1 Arc family DNA-binding protein [Pseudomonas aeruginosa]ELK6189191.1 Arc family DNA-binding protein [Pseudomonas aeruginosa]MBG4559734.1 Arc family DNA-binding protein [Pseudomonas aeruginosa]MBG6316745.1 Arc family DNA-binding protein [Pseudomonas aeruginosa]MBG6689567.1 Arc family DNA-binding protein [Pseudomonas aeruginosa]
MSREDPQFKLRMPAELRARAEQAANASGRSLNAELVARLETSFLPIGAPETLITASKARELASMARAGIPEEIRRRTLIAINRAVTLGHSSASIDLKDLKLDDGLGDEELEELFKDVSKELIEAGYEIEIDGGSWIWVKF